MLAHGLKYRHPALYLPSTRYRCCAAATSMMLNTVGARHDLLLFRNLTTGSLKLSTHYPSLPTGHRERRAINRSSTADFACLVGLSPLELPTVFYLKFTLTTCL
jgi:hypothetical protein